MALLPWDDEDERKRDELNAPAITRIASVQSGSWQPAASGADSAVATDDVTQGGQGGIFGSQPQPVVQQPQDTNYLMSDEHAQVEQQKRQRDAEIEAARQEQAAARQRAEAAAAVSENFKEGKNAQGQTLNVDEIKKDQGWKKYYDKAFKQERDSLDFWGRLMDGGQASRRAETIARNRYNSELIQKAYDENGNLLDENAALQARKLSAYNKALAEDNSNRSMVLARAIGATKDNESHGFMGRLKDAINAEKQMNIWDAVVGADDTQKTDLNDVGRFGGGLVQGFATMIPIGLKELEEAGTGHGTSSKTGFEEDLSGGERVGRGVSGALNVVTPFVGGSGKFLDSFTTKAMTKGLSEAEGKVATQLASRVISGGASEAEERVFASLAAKAANNAATQAEKSAIAKLTSQLVLPAVEQGGIGAAQAGGEYFGNGGTLTDENGNLDMDKVQEFLKQTGEAGAMGVGGGLVLGGAGMGVRRLRNGKPMPVLSPGELAELETANTNSGTAQMEAMRAQNAEPNFSALEGTDITPVEAPVADGVVAPDVPNIDQPTPVAEGTAVSQNADVPPGSTLPAAATPDVLTGDVAPADGVAQTVPAEVTPVREPAIETPAATPATADLPVPGEVTPASGTVVAQAPGQAVLPARDKNQPTVAGEELRTLQESRAGKSQADEAAIAQRIQELQSIPRGERTEAQRAELDDKILGGFNSVRKQLGDESFYNDFLQQEADKPTRSADLAAEIIGKVENDGMSIKDAIDDSILPTPAADPRETAANAYDSLSSEVRRLEKSANQPGLWKAVQQQMKGMTLEERVQYLNDRVMRMRDEGVMAKDFVNQQNGTVPENPVPAAPARIDNSGAPIKVEEVNPDGSRSGDSQTVEFPSQENVATYRAKKIELNNKGEGYSSSKSDIVIKDSNGNELQRIPYDKAAEKWGTTDPNILAQKLVNGSVEVAPVKPPLENSQPTNANFERDLNTGKMKFQSGQSKMPSEDVTPFREDSVPEMEAPSDGSLTPVQVAERLMPKLADNADVKKRIAEAAGMGKDSASPVEEILSNAGVKPKTAERITKHFTDLEEQVQNYNRLTEQNQKAYAEGGVDALDENVSRERSRVAREMGTTTRRLMTEIKRMEGGRDHKVALINGLTDIIGTRNANVLTSAGLLERNIFQEMTANAKLAVKNPIKMIRSTFGNGNILKDTAKSELSHWKDAPRNPIEAVKYVVGNTYRTLMTPTTALANTRRGAVRDELTRWAFQELEGRKVSASEAHKLAGTAGNEMEALVNTFIGVDNGMTNRKQATEALKAWKEYIRTGDDGAKSEFLRHVEEHNSLADQMIAGLSKEDAVRAKGLMAVKNLIFPFVRTATNLTKNAFKQDLNPFAKSLLDEIKADQTGRAGNAINLVKSKLVDYGIMGGAAALASSGVLVYNDGDEVDKPKGWSIKIGDGKYVPVRSTSLELPIAMAGTAYRMATDVGKGDARDWKYYAGMITGSLPYIDQMNTTTGAVDSAMNANDESGDGGYAAKNYAVQSIKSFVPGSNNGVQAYVAGKEGKSLDAKTVYDKNFGTWLQNAIHKSYDPDFYNGLKTSRDNAGRTRTVDNQGVVTNKTINDASTAEFNDRITELVDYGRKNGLGKNTQDMFNTYDTGKNNNFKSVQDSITFLDVEDGGKPDNTKKLEKNGKLTNLSQQMRDGFFGDSGDELLTLDGKNLYSDVSVPNSAGSKNSKLPISMQSIKNAIAQTDLSPEARDRIKEISDSDTALYNRLKAKEITYDQYSAEKAKTGAEYVDILSSSKNYQKMLGLFDELDQTGFFDADGMGSTKSGQTYLWNSLNALLGSKGATPAANFPDLSKGFTPWGNRGTGRSSKSGGRFDGTEGLKWTPVGRRQLASVPSAQYTPVKIKVKLGNAIKRDRSQNYSDRSF